MGSTVPRRQLARRLRALRESRQLTVNEVCAALEWSKPRIWRYETGQVPIHPTDVEVMCRLYGADAEMIDAMKALARQTKAKGWWHPYGVELPDWFELYADMEAAASHIRYHHAELIPGLLQTRPYMWKIIQMDYPVPDEETERRVALRLQRQSILTRRDPTAPTLDVILSEAALHRGFDRDVMRDQLTYLAGLVERPNISLRVLPFMAGPHRGFHGPFVMLDFPRETAARDPEPTTIYQEGQTGALYLDKPAEIEVYEAVWSDLVSKALGELESRDMIAKTARELE